ncbi:TfdA family taurine catabolism dioxygenase TauD [Tricharina praecox]|uniref:TfdA family taurine catabolism dioxygenase TauD n=1 Tax=Tricharina praecox TaxID=43433 RepID=UPI00221F818B|nr:TfdA family taurine catabolism dioxygenase TauD [Tricharina praecox]KAI5845345.1 TfdA family taurine catabolism dioxygenase TauD [Tricharina praecox]
MAPSTISLAPSTATASATESTKLKTTPTPTPTQAVNTLTAPLPYPPAFSPLLSHPHHESTPVIGTEFSGDFQLSSILSSPTSLQHLASLISHRGVVFFRGQEITPSQQRELVQSLGELSGKPATSGLHIHPLTRENGKDGDHISIISSEERIKYENARKERERVRELGWEKGEESQLASVGWHADITFENVPSDYATLKVHTQPATGGDTLWASGYEVYDRLSPSFRAYLETLSAVHNADRFKEVAAARGHTLRNHRGAPENNDLELTAVHPVIRTNPVTGWKSVFVNRSFTKRILGVSIDESELILNHLFRLVSENHDLQVRFRWARYKDGETGDVAVWDNRSTFHTATDDYIETGGVRSGDRAVSLGERPFYGGQGERSRGRREALGWRGVERIY